MRAGSGPGPVPVSARLGRGAAHSSRADIGPRRIEQARSPINARDLGTITGRDARARSAPHRGVVHRVGLGPVGVLGPEGQEQVDSFAFDARFVKEIYLRTTEAKPSA